jgi:hypothetical protein
MIASRDISREVLRGIELNSPQWEAAADAMVLRPFRRVAHRAVPCQGSNIWDHVQDGRWVYRMYHFTK